MPVTTAVVLVSGRSALARLGGVASVARHVAALRRLGLEPIVVFPDSRQALGVEAAGQVGAQTVCLAADSLGDRAGADDDTVLVAAADWYLSFRGIEEFCKTGDGPAVVRVASGELESVPLARLKVKTLKALLPQLASRSVGTLIGRHTPEDAEAYELVASDQQRLSDNVSVMHAEEKLFTPTLGPAEGFNAGRLKRVLAEPLVKLFAMASISPTQIAIAKIAVGLIAAYVLARPGYRIALAGALLFFASRVLDAVAGTVARAALRDNPRRRHVDFVGDVLVLLAVLCGAGLHVGELPEAMPLVLVACAGVLIGAATVYKLVLRDFWASISGPPAPRSNPVTAPRLAHRDGAAYGLCLAAFIGRVDLFLWAAAVATHVFYIVWIAARSKGEHHPMALRPST